MYKCGNCGCRFSEPVRCEECIGEAYGSPVYDTYLGCPKCKDYDIEVIWDDEND